MRSDREDVGSIRPRIPRCTANKLLGGGEYQVPGPRPAPSRSRRMSGGPVKLLLRPELATRIAWRDGRAKARGASSSREGPRAPGAPAPSIASSVPDKEPDRLGGAKCSPWSTPESDFTRSWPGPGLDSAVKTLESLSGVGAGNSAATASRLRTVRTGRRRPRLVPPRSDGDVSR